MRLHFNQFVAQWYHHFRSSNNIAWADTANDESLHIGQAISQQIERTKFKD